jgi:hypothetical protein
MAPAPEKPNNQNRIQRPMAKALCYQPLCHVSQVVANGFLDTEILV